MTTTLTLTRSTYSGAGEITATETATLRVPNAWKHHPSRPHYRVSERQAVRARRLLAEGYQLPQGASLWISDSDNYCPHCVGEAVSV